MQIRHATLIQNMRTIAEFPLNVRSCEQGRMFQIQVQKTTAKYRLVLRLFVAFVRKLIRIKTELNVIIDWI